MMQDIHDVLEPIPIAAAANIPWLFLAVCAVFAVVVIRLVVWFLRHRVRRPLPISPEQHALRRLSQAGKADVRAYYFELTAILAEYLDAHYELQFAQCTSAEMLRRMRDLGVVTKDGFEALREFLYEADRVKYAPTVQEGDANPDADEAGRNCQRLIYLIGGQIASMRRLSQPTGAPHHV